MATADATQRARTDRTPAQLYALIFGVTLLLAGVLGFIADATFGDLGSDVEGGKLVLFEVNGWHNLVHLASGVLGLAVAGNRDSARAFALGFGAVYLVVTIIGFIDGDSIFGLLPVNTEDNVLHLLIGIAGLGAYAATPAVTKPTTTRTDADATGAAA